jgi:hypothetical protein
MAVRGGGGETPPARSQLAKRETAQSLAAYAAASVLCRGRLRKR